MTTDDEQEYSRIQLKRNTDTNNNEKTEIVVEARWKRGSEEAMKVWTEETYLELARRHKSEFMA